MSTAAIQMTEAAAQTQLESLRSDVQKINALVEQVATVNSPEKESRAAEFCQQIKIRIDKAEDARTFLVKPLNDHVKKINSSFKETTQPLQEALDTIKQGIMAWRQSEEVRQAKELAEKAKFEAQVAASQGDVETLQEKAAEVKEAQLIATPKIETQTGKTTFRKMWKWEIIDILELPAGYWVPDEKLIAADVKLGRSIPGVKAWQEEMPVFGS